MTYQQLTAEDALEISRALKNGEPQAILAEDFGISQQSVSAINTGLAWSQVTGIPHHPTPRNQLTVEDVRAIDLALRQGVRARLIAATYAVSEQAISNIKCGRNWTWITGRAPNKRVAQ